MASYNRVILIGNLTRDPELRYIPSGTAVCEIGLAVNDRRKGPNGDWIEETTFVDVTLWGRTAEVCSEYCTKGSPLFVEGRLKYDSWEKEGKKFSKLRVVGDKIQFIGSKGGQGGGGGGGGGQRPRQQQPQQGGSGGGGYDDADYGAPADMGSYGGGSPGPSGGGGDDIPF
jgi:single-strand DNA-binding protein